MLYPGTSVIFFSQNFALEIFHLYLLLGTATDSHNQCLLL